MRDYSRGKRFSNRILEVYAKAALPEGLKVVAANGGAPAEILLYDEIGFFGITAKDFREALTQAGEGNIKLRINSPGGDVFDGVAIYNAIKERGDVDAWIDGVAASAASFIAMAADKVNIAENAIIMIHNSSGIVIGNAEDMMEMASLLEKVDGQIADMYAAKTGKKREGWAEAMAAETWYTGLEAKDAGLADNVTPNKSRAGADNSASQSAAPATNPDRYAPIADSDRRRRMLKLAEAS